MTGLAVALCLAGCHRPQSAHPAQTARALFTAELAKHGITRLRDLPDGRIEVALSGTKVLVSLDNVGRDYAREHDPGIVARFAAQVAQGFPKPLTWKVVRNRLFLVAEGTHSDLGETIRTQITPRITRMVAYMDSPATQIRYIDRSELANWHKSETEVTDIAAQNSRALLAGLKLHVEDVGGGHVAWFETDLPIKASFIFSPALKQRVQNKLGWPVLAVIPCRDFLYLMPATDRGILDRVGVVIREEYEEGAYPLTDEVLEISDGGVRAIGRFASTAGAAPRGRPEVGGEMRR